MEEENKRGDRRNVQSAKPGINADSASLVTLTKVLLVFLPFTTTCCAVDGIHNLLVVVGLVLQRS